MLKDLPCIKVKVKVKVKITLSTKVHLVKAMVFPEVMCGCESWTIKKAERWRIDAFELWCWRRLLRVPWTARSGPWNSLGRNTGVGSLSVLQEIFPNQGSNPCLPHCRRILYQLSHKGSPRILEWVTYPFSSGSSQPKNRTGVSYIAGGFFTNWAIREALIDI